MINLLQKDPRDLKGSAQTRRAAASPQGDTGDAKAGRNYSIGCDVFKVRGREGCSIGCDVFMVREKGAPLGVMCSW